MNKLDTTLASLSNIIVSLTNSINLYSRLNKLNPECSDIIHPLFKHAEEFLDKLLKEYRRLSKEDYLPALSLETEFYNINSESTLVECLRSEANLINIYSETINEDVLWEVLPLLARHLSSLKTYQQLMIDNIDHYNSRKAASVGM